jgi:hypothetical protein
MTGLLRPWGDPRSCVVLLDSGKELRPEFHSPAHFLQDSDLPFVASRRYM